MGSNRTQLSQTYLKSKTALMTGFDCYRTYLAFKNHFTKDNFDYFKYGGKTNATTTWAWKHTKKAALQPGARDWGAGQGKTRRRENARTRRRAMMWTK